MAERSYSHAVRKRAFREGIVLPERVATRSSNERPVTLYLRPSLCASVRKSVLRGIKDIKFTKLELNIAGDDLSEGKNLCYDYFRLSVLSFPILIENMENSSLCQNNLLCIF